MEENSEKSSRNKVQQSILSFVKSKQVKSRISVKTRMKTQKVPKHNGSQNFEVQMITLQRYRKSGRKVDSTTSNKSTCENNTPHAKSELPKGQQLLTLAIGPTPNQPDR